MNAAAKALTWTARIVRCDVHDGDTLVNVSIDVGWRLTLSGTGTSPMSIRLTSSRGPINAPEVTGKEASVGWLVRDWLGAILSGGQDAWNGGRVHTDAWLVSRALDRDAYGRVIGEVHVDGRGELGLEMLDRGLVKCCAPGGKRVPFTDIELGAIIATLGGGA